MKKYVLILSRIGAYIIDYILFFVLIYLIGKYGALYYLLSLSLFFLYRYLTTAIYGATLGMLALKLTLDKFDLRICFKREMLRLASAFYYIGYIYGIFDKLGRTFHDVGSNTYVRYKASESKKIAEATIFRRIIYVIFVVAVTKAVVSFVLNDIGLIGLERICKSEEYFQSFEGDNLTSLSQQELYSNTLGRKYTTLIDFGGKPFMIKLSNKLKYTEVYKMKISGSQIQGEFAYRINMPLQFICSGTFRSSTELCGISPGKELILVDERGKIYAYNKVALQNILSMKCGDIDGDGKCEIVMMSRSGEVEIYKYENANLNLIYNKRIGEDIISQAFYIKKGIVLVSRGGNKSVVYYYDYKNKNFILSSKKYLKLKELSAIEEIDGKLIVSNINRSNMMLGIGKIQRLELYSNNGKRDKISKLCNFGSRPNRWYSFLVRNLEGVYDINGDGKEELVLKAVNKQDVMGNGYIVEVYKFNKAGILINRILTKIEMLLNLEW